MPSADNAVTLDEILTAFALLLRDELFAGEELALIEPFNGPRPGAPFASIALESVAPVGGEVYECADEDGAHRETVRGESLAVVVITFHGAGARRLAVECRNLLRSTNRLFDLTRLIGFGAAGEITAAPVERQGRMEERAALRVEFHCNLSATYDAGVVEAVRGDIRRAGMNLPYAAGTVRTE